VLQLPLSSPGSVLPRMAKNGEATEEQVEEEPGEEVFRRLYRLFPLANPHDYFKNGQWQVEMIQIDADLIEAHRREAGAEEPPPLEEVELPADMPRVQVGRPLGMGLGIAARAAASNGSSPGMSAGGTIRATRPATGSLAGPAAASSAASAYARPAATRPAPVPVRPVSTAGKGTLGTARGPGSTSQELQQIGSFIETWGLEASKAKLCLARLTPTRRRWVLDNYDGTQGLEDYIKECQESNAWGDAGPAGAVKRPLSAGAMDPSKRPRPGVPSSYGSYGAKGNGYASAYGAPRVSSFRPAAAGVRPAAPARAFGYAPRPAAGVRPVRPAVSQAGTMYARPGAARPYGGKGASPALRKGEARPGSMIGNLLRR